MLTNNIDSEKLFAKPIPVTIKDGLSSQCRSNYLFLTVEWQEASAAIYGKELLVTLTDGNDPFFLYNLHLSEEDFQILKSSQGLLVDFSAFPQKFIDLLELCLAEESKAQPKFLLILNVGEKVGCAVSSAQLDVVETNPFKHLTHLSLKFMVASESTVKQYLSVCFRNLKEDKRNLQNRLCFLERDFKEKSSTLQGALEKKSQELETVRKELSVELSIQQSQHTKQLVEEREKLLNKQKEEEIKFEREKQIKEDNFKKQIQQLELRESCLNNLNKEIQDKNSKQETTIRELRTCVLSLEEEINKTKESLRTSQEQNGKLQVENKKSHLQLCHQKDKINELEQENCLKQQHMSRLQEQLNNYSKQEREYKEELDLMKDRLRKKEREYKNQEEDISKANQIIGKLQQEIQVGHEKLKSWNKLSSKHEHNIQERERIIQVLRKDLTDSRIECKKQSSEIKILSDASTSLKEKIAHLEKEAKEHNNVIKYLNRQLTESRIQQQISLPKEINPSHKEFNESIKSGSGDARVLQENHFSAAARATRPKSLTRKKVSRYQHTSDELPKNH